MYIFRFFLIGVWNWQLQSKFKSRQKTIGPCQTIQCSGSKVTYTIIMVCSLLYQLKCYLWLLLNLFHKKVTITSSIHREAEIPNPWNVTMSFNSIAEQYVFFTHWFFIFLLKSVTTFSSVYADIVLSWSNIVC